MLDLLFALSALDPLAAGPLDQFEIKTIIPIQIGGLDLSFTNASLFMVLAAGLIAGFMTFAVSSRGLEPGRLQSVAEVSYEFVANMVKDTAGKDGLKFFPFLFTLFTFVLACNLLGMVPYGFTVTSHLVVTFTLAALVIGLVIGYGLFKHGLKFFNVFAPSGVPPLTYVILIPIEIVSFLARPVSLSLRLFGNMMAGHMVLKIFGSFVVSLAGLGVLGWAGAIAPLIGIVAVTMLEFLVAVVQAYIFAILSSIYLADALHPSH
jgi:F-type H+-transporting ATPase subunit a